MENEKIKKIGFEIDRLKRSKKMTTKEISNKLGVSQQATSKVINSLKRGNSCSLKTLIKIFEVLGEDFTNYRYE